MLRFSNLLLRGGQQCQESNGFFAVQISHCEGKVNYTLTVLFKKGIEKSLVSVTTDTFLCLAVVFVRFIYFLYIYVQYIYCVCVYFFFSRLLCAQLCTCCVNTNTCTHSPQASVLVVILTSSRNRIMGRGPLTWGRRKCEI